MAFSQQDKRNQHQNAVARMMQQLKERQQMEQYRKNKRNQNVSSGIKTAKTVKGAYDKYNQFKTANDTAQGVNALQNTANTYGAVSNAIQGGQELGSMSSALSNAAPSASALTSGASSGASAASGAAGAAGGASSAMGSVMPGIGSAIKGYQAYQDAQNGDYVGAGLNGVGAVANFIPGVGTVISAATSVADVINKQLRSAKDKANAKAAEFGTKNAAESQQNFAQEKTDFQNQAQDNLQQLAQETQQDYQHTDTTSQGIFDRMKTNLGIGDEIGYQIEKANSPFAFDSGFDYDLRGAYQQNGTLNSTAANGHLGDEYKLPNHETFSTDSNLAHQGLRNLAINPEGHTYLPNGPQESLDAIRNGLTPYNSESPNLNDLVSGYINTPNDIQTPQNEPLVPMENEGSIIGGASGVEGELPAIKLNDDGSVYKQRLFDRIKQSLGNFSDLSTGYKDNLMNDYAHGDLARRIGGGVTPQPQVSEIAQAMSNAKKDDGSALYTPEQISAAQQGLNGGDKNIAALIDQYKINKPTTKDEIASAEAGTFNQQPVIGGITNDDRKKTILERVGEGIGTAQRIASNPATQGLIALASSRMAGDDWGTALKTGAKWGAKKAASDRYQKILDPNSAPSIMASYTDDDYRTIMNQKNNDRDFEYKKERDKVSDEHWNKNFDETKRYHDGSLANGRIRANNTGRGRGGNDFQMFKYLQGQNDKEMERQLKILEDQYKYDIGNISQTDDYGNKTFGEKQMVDTKTGKIIDIPLTEKEAKDRIRSKYIRQRDAILNGGGQAVGTAGKTQYSNSDPLGLF